MLMEWQSRTGFPRHVLHARLPGRGTEEASVMELQGIHHITAITADAPGNVDFYAGLLGLRFVKKTVNFDLPEVYHLYFADEEGSPGSILTFFEFPGAQRGRPGAGAIDRIRWRVPTEASLDFWGQRLEAAGVAVEGGGGWVRFADPEGLGLEIVAEEPRVRLTARADDIPEEHALAGFAGVRALGPRPASEPVLAGVLGFRSEEPEGREGSGGSSFRLEGQGWRSSYTYAQAPADPAIQGAGSVHHIAWAARPEDHESWHRHVVHEGLRPTPIIDRTYFRSIYFREPSGVLFEIATIGPGFAIDEAPEHLGEALMLPERYEPRRAELERTLVPLRNPRAPRQERDEPEEVVSG
jgi:glyoxalase family protein